MVIKWAKLADTKSDVSGDTDVSGTYYSIGGFLGGHCTSGSGREETELLNSLAQLVRRAQCSQNTQTPAGIPEGIAAVTHPHRSQLQISIKHWSILHQDKSVCLYILLHIGGRK